MSELSEMKCEACRADAPVVTVEEIQQFHPQIPEWQIIEPEGIPRLQRVFTFPNFKDAFEFTKRVGALAEEEGHHPAILLEWGKVTVNWWTHKIRNLHRNDFIMARKTDELL